MQRHFQPSTSRRISLRQSTEQRLLGRAARVLGDSLGSFVFRASSRAEGNAGTNRMVLWDWAAEQLASSCAQTLLGWQSFPRAKVRHRLKK